MKVPIDRYLKCKEEYKEMSSMFGMEARPVDMNGNVAPLGNSIADRTRNIHDVARDIQKRVGC